MVLLWVTPSVRPRTIWIRFGVWTFDTPVAALAMVGLYWSSLSTSALRAWLVSLATLFVAANVVLMMRWPATAVALATFSWPEGIRDAYQGYARSSDRWLWSELLVPTIALTLRYAFSNHGQSLPDRRTVTKQLAVLLVTFALGTFVATTIQITLDIGLFSLVHARLPTLAEALGRTPVR
jgi:hypothetical protein